LTRPEIGCLQNNQKWISKHRLFRSNLETEVGYRKLAAKYGIPPLLVFFTNNFSYHINIGEEHPTLAADF
jgi:hypothetical protein